MRNIFFLGLSTLFFSINSIADTGELLIKGELTNKNKCRFDKSLNNVVCNEKTFHTKIKTTTKLTNKTNSMKQKNKNDTLVNTVIYIY